MTGRLAVIPEGELRELVGGAPGPASDERHGGSGRGDRGRAQSDILAGGEALLVFPEGTRIRRPGLGDAKEGIALLASQSGVPVVPVWVGHTYEPRRGIFRRIPIEVRFGPPIDFGDGSGSGEGDRRQRYAAMTAQVMAAIAELGGVETPAARVETAS